MFKITDLMIKVVPEDNGRALWPEELTFYGVDCQCTDYCSVPAACTGGCSLPCSEDTCDMSDQVHQPALAEQERRDEALAILKAALRERLTHPEPQGIFVG
jgi:hypothetical protein